MHHHEGAPARNGRHGHASALTAGLVALTAGAAAVFVANRMMSSGRRPDPRDAPRSAVRGGAGMTDLRGDTLVGRTVTVDRPRSELYAAWRDFARLPDFMENLRSVEILSDTRSRWTVKAPGEANLTFETEITEDVPGEVIAWQSTEDAPVPNSGRVTFRDAPGGRGTQVELRIAYDPPGGAVGQMAAKLFQREPNIQARRELKRFKQLMEAGEIATAEPGPAAPRGE